MNLCNACGPKWVAQESLPLERQEREHLERRHKILKKDKADYAAKFTGMASVIVGDPSFDLRTQRYLNDVQADIDAVASEIRRRETLAQSGSTCPKCDRAVQEDFVKCPYCGHELKATLACPHCGKGIKSDFEMCPYCGGALGGAVLE